MTTLNLSIPTLTLLSLLAACGDLTAKFAGKVQGGVDPASPQGGGGSGGNDDGEKDLGALALDIVDGPTTGIKTGDQIHLTFAKLTGTESLLANISSYDNNITCSGSYTTPTTAGQCILRRFELERESLPTSTLLSAYAAPHRLAILRLAAEHCAAMVDQQLISDWLLQAEFAIAASRLLAPGSDRRARFIEALYSRFWEGRLAKLPPMPEIKTTLDGLISELIAARANTNARSVAIAACSAALSSTVSLITY